MCNLSVSVAATTRLVFCRDYRRRDLTPPVDYPDRASDLQLFARQYDNQGDDYFYGGNRGTERETEK